MNSNDHSIKEHLNPVVKSKPEGLPAYVDDILRELRSLLLRKQEDYGPLNISLAPGGPYNGLRVRMFDKLQRFSHLVESGNDTPNFESLRDTFLDLANYAIIGILVQNGQWEGIPDAKDHSVKRPSNSLPRPDCCESSTKVNQTGETPRIVVRR